MCYFLIYECCACGGCAWLHRVFVWGGVGRFWLWNDGLSSDASCGVFGRLCMFVFELYWFFEGFAEGRIILD